MWRVLLLPIVIVFCLNSSAISSNTCKDTNDSCGMWAKSGECQVNPKYMLGSCPDSCHQCSCGDNSKECGSWAKEGQCKKLPSYMLLHCRESCGECTKTKSPRVPGCPSGAERDHEIKPCKNEHESCEVWATIGECTKNPGYMLVNCRKSCEQCESDGTPDPPRPCIDEHDSCAGWAAVEECTKNPGYMLVKCRKSCRECGTEPMKETSPANPCLDDPFNPANNCPALVEFHFL